MSTATATTIAGTMLQELEQEAATTRRLLERVPDSRTSWRPHEKSWTLGELAMHIAMVPGGVAEFVARPSPVQAPEFPTPPAAPNTAELLRRFDESIAKARTVLSGMDDEAAMEMWRMVNGGRDVMAMPRAAFMRAIMLNHWYHHRGQLLVYLRLLDQSVPSVYGPTADENPFAA